MSDRRLNCWEYKNCGRERGGLMAPVLGECPVSTAMRCDGINGGIGAGRACWSQQKAGSPSCLFRSSSGGCHNCEFYRRVMHEESDCACRRFESIPA